MPEYLFNEVIRRFPSKSRPGSEYEVRLRVAKDYERWLTCNCKAWTTSPAQKGKTEQQRQCKHTVQTISDDVGDIGAFVANRVEVYQWRGVPWKYPQAPREQYATVALWKAAQDLKGMRGETQAPKVGAFAGWKDSGDEAERDRKRAERDAEIAKAIEKQERAARASKSSMLGDTAAVQKARTDELNRLYAQRQEALRQEAERAAAREEAKAEEADDIAWLKANGFEKTASAGGKLRGRLETFGDGAKALTEAMEDAASAAIKWAGAVDQFGNALNNIPAGTPVYLERGEERDGEPPETFADPDAFADWFIESMGEILNSYSGPLAWPALALLATAIGLSDTQAYNPQALFPLARALKLIVTPATNADYSVRSQVRQMCTALYQSGYGLKEMYKFIEGNSETAIAQMLKGVLAKKGALGFLLQSRGLAKQLEGYRNADAKALNGKLPVAPMEEQTDETDEDDARWRYVQPRTPRSRIVRPEGDDD